MQRGGGRDPGVSAVGQDGSRGHEAVPVMPLAAILSKCQMSALSCILRKPKGPDQLHERRMISLLSLLFPSSVTSKPSQQLPPS